MAPGDIRQTELPLTSPASASNYLLRNKMNEHSGRSQQQGSPDNAYLRQILQREASGRSNELSRAAVFSGVPPTLGAGSAGLRSSFSQHERLMRGGAPLSLGMRSTQGLDLAGLPPNLRQSQSLSMPPPNLRAAQSLTLDAPGFGRNTSLDYTRTAALGSGAPGMYSSFSDQRQRIMMAQQQQQQQLARFGMPGGAMLGSPMTAGRLSNPPVWRNLPNEGVTAQGLEMLRAASMSLPNRSGPRLEPAAARRGPAAQDRNLAASMGARASGLSPEGQNNWGSVAENPNKRKANREVDSDNDEAESSVNKVFIPEVRELDILCGRGGKSNHHFGNKRYRQVVSEMKNMYRSTEAKTVKTDLSRAIVDHVCGYGGRFVKKDSQTGRYYLLTKAEARKKTSQALRETKALKWTM